MLVARLEGDGDHVPAGAGGIEKCPAVQRAGQPFSVCWLGCEGAGSEPQRGHLACATTIQRKPRASPRAADTGRQPASPE